MTTRFEYHNMSAKEQHEGLEHLMQMTPAEYVISVFQGVRATARALGRSPSSVSKWQKPREMRGCGGNIPGAAQRLILDLARKRGLDITPDDLINGRRTSKRRS